MVGIGKPDAGNPLVRFNRGSPDTEYIVYEREGRSTMKSDQELPKNIQALLWSYKLDHIDLSVHKRIIISQVLNFGSEDATRWLFQQYEPQEIVRESNQIPVGQWDKKSLSLWSLVLGIHPVSKFEKVSHVV